MRLTWPLPQSPMQMENDMRLTNAQMAILQEIAEGPRLALRYSRKTAEQILRRGLIRTCDHPDSVDRRYDPPVPAMAYELTYIGRQACKWRGLSRTEGEDGGM